MCPNARCAPTLGVCSQIMKSAGLSFKKKRHFGRGASVRAVADAGITDEASRKKMGRWQGKGRGAIVHAQLDGENPYVFRCSELGEAANETVQLALLGVAGPCLDSGVVHCDGERVGQEELFAVGVLHDVAIAYNGHITIT